MKSQKQYFIWGANEEYVILGVNVKVNL